jgi:hypothetical protein
MFEVLLWFAKLGVGVGEDDWFIGFLNSPRAYTLVVLDRLFAIGSGMNWLPFLYESLKSSYFFLVIVLSNVY